MSDFSARELNSLFLEELNDPDGIKKIAAEGGDFIRTKLRETSFARKILQPEVVTPGECQRSVHHDSLVKIVDKEPDTKALIMSLRGQPSANYIEGDRFEIPFFLVSTEEFQKTEEELLAYQMPLMDIIERNSVLDIQKIEDQVFMDHVELVLKTFESTQTVSGLTYSSDGAHRKTNFEKLFNLIDGNELASDIVLMNNKMYNKLINFDASEFGDDLGKETFINGYTYQKLFGRNLVVTNKKRWNSVTINGTSYSAGSDLVPDGHIYCFAKKEFFGKFYTLGDTKFYIDKRRNLISMSAYEHIGMAIGNTKGVAKIIING